MFILITYDVNTEGKAGRRRLQRIAKCCQNYGVRVQNSVFECQADAATWCVLKQKLLKEMDEKCDSLRFYYLGNNFKSKVEHFGAKPGISVDEPLLF